ncbi:MAG: TIGR03862 family flavoprotein [Alphaproteobacteria bacterium]|nr:TIGR03862 family flavoprotein [Alphaproteobacteria bacterium]
MAADVVSAESGGQIRVTVYDRMPSVGRKFLMAGRGGLNLTHSEDLERFLERYGGRADELRPVIEAFGPDAVKSWCEGLGQQTFTGSSGRVFPKSMKASPLLRAWLRRLGERGVEFKTRQRWLGWGETGQLKFEGPEGLTGVAADAVVLALGGGSWARLGSDGGWVEILRGQGVGIADLAPSNCGFTVEWSDHFRGKFQGQPLKRIALQVGDRTVRGEAMITAGGLEGGAIYALSGPLREAILRDGCATLHIDLRPDIMAGDLAVPLDGPRKKQSLSTFLRKAGRLSPPAIGLLQEAALSMPVRLGDLGGEELTALIKAVPVGLTGIASMDRAISTAGGVRFDEVDGRFMLSNKPGVFVAGEMLDWDAPTGGYLLQASFATGAAAGRGVVDWLAGK